MIYRCFTAGGTTVLSGQVSLDVLHSCQKFRGVLCTALKSPPCPRHAAFTVRHSSAPGVRAAAALRAGLPSHCALRRVHPLLSAGTRSPRPSVHASARCNHPLCVGCYPLFLCLEDLLTLSFCRQFGSNAENQFFSPRALDSSREITRVQVKMCR